jgi:hypothetical protein
MLTRTINQLLLAHPRHKCLAGTLERPPLVGTSARSSGQAVRGDRREASLPSGSGFVQQLQELMSCEFDLFVPPLSRSVMARDQAGAVEAAEITVDEGVSRLRLL